MTVVDPLADFDAEIRDALQTAGVPAATLDQLAHQLTTPADRSFGERASNAAFLLARERRAPPRQIAQDLAAAVSLERYRFIRAVEPAGAGFLNFRLDYRAFTAHVMTAVADAGAEYGRRPDTTPQRIVVEHTSVNPNKEWHIGHVRNAVLGDVVARVLRLSGHDVQVQNYIDDTGMQAAQAVYGLQAFPEEPRPGEKFDQYAGRAYVKVAAELAAEKDLRARLETESDPGARVMLQTRLENLDTHLKPAILRTMHLLEEGEFTGTIEQILDAQLQSAYRLGIFYELLNWESHLVQSHLLESAIESLMRSDRVYRPDEGHYAGALVIETEPASDGNEMKAEVLIRRSGLPTYVGKDIAYHMWKFGLLSDRLHYVKFAVQPNGEVLESTALHGESRPHVNPDRVINIIAVDQTRAQETVKAGLEAAGHADAAERLFHLPYGLVTTAAGKMSGRKGAVSGDSVIDEAVRTALERVREKRSQDLDDAEMERIAEAVGVGAVRYFMAQYNPLRDIVFDVGAVVSYDGNTALYIQYALVRMFAILRRAATEHGVSDDDITGANVDLLTHEQEERLIYHLAQYPDWIAAAARTLSVNLAAEYAYTLATIFSQFYRDCGVLNADPPLRAARLLLVRTVRDVLVNACSVLGVPVIERL